jgi:hypothetical protein
MTTPIGTLIQRIAGHPRAQGAERAVTGRARREHRHDEGHRGRCGHGRADALRGAGGDEGAGCLGECSGHRGGGEQGDPAEEDPSRSDHVGQAATEEEEPAEQQGIGIDDPGDSAGGEAEIGLDRRQGDVDDGRVEHEKELGGRQQGEGGALRPDGARDESIVHGPLQMSEQLHGLYTCHERHTA